MQEFCGFQIKKDRKKIPNLLDQCFLDLMYRMLRNLNIFKKIELMDNTIFPSKYVDHFNTVFPKLLQEATNRNLDVENIKRNLEAILDEGRTLLDYDGYKLPYEPDSGEELK